MRYTTVLFDLDGTLMDTLEDIRDSVNHVLSERGYSERNLEQIRMSLGNGSRVLLAKSLPDGENTADFLEGALAQLGLTEQEVNEFIIYWLPKMEHNPYNLISFQQEAYTDSAKLTIDPAPDTLIRVFMAWQGLDQPVEVEPQILTAPERTGFTAVEWGGAEIGA